MIDTIYSVGIDVSKGSSMVAILRPDGKTVQRPYQIKHDKESLEQLSSRLISLDGETRVILEYTGRYHEPVVRKLQESGIFVCAVNPSFIKQYGNNTLRKAKTDKKDARKIARYGLENWNELLEYGGMDKIRQQLKMLNRQFHLYSKTMVSLKNNLIALLDISFPGINDFFDSPARKDGHQKWVDFAGEYWHAECVSSLRERVFLERYRKWCKKNGYFYQPDKAREIHKASLQMVPVLPRDEDTRVLIQTAVSQLTTISTAVETYRMDMLRLAERLPEFPVVMSLYGVGPSLGPQIMAEIGDVRRFNKKSQLTAFAGVDPGVNQSGSHEAKSMPVSKHGSPYLREALFNVMDCMIKTKPLNEPVYQFMDRKRSEGKEYYVYMTAGCNKFLKIYYGRVREYLESLDQPETE